MPSDSAAASEFGAGSPSASTPDFSSLSGVPEEEYEKILKAYKDRLEDEATRAPNRNRLLMARRQTKDFKPGYTIRFLPNACHIELVPSKGLDFDGDSFGLEMPVWEPVIGPTKKVGIATDMQTPTLKTTNRHTITIQMAGMDVYLRPKVKNPFYDLTVGGITVNKTCVRFDDMADQYQTRMEEFKEKMTKWRTQRRAWELQLVEKLWIKGNLKMFKPGFDIGDIVAARRHVDQQDKDDAAGLISPWNIGLPEGEWVPSFVQSGRPTKDVIANDTAQLDSAIQELQQKILKLQKQKAKEERKPREAQKRKRGDDGDSSGDSLDDLGLEDKVYPPPGQDWKLLVNWQLGRHVHWAKEDIDTSNHNLASRETFKMRRRRDLELGKSYLPGNLGVNPELCRIQPDLPWGFPARALERHAREIYQERAWHWMVQDRPKALLGKMERWFFGLTEEERATLSDDQVVLESMNLPFWDDWKDAFTITDF